jgi:hypothetical protein
MQSRVWALALFAFAVHAPGAVEAPARDQQTLTQSAIVAAVDEQFQLRFREPDFGAFGFTRMCAPEVHTALVAASRSAKRQLRRRSTNRSLLFGSCGSADWAFFEPRNQSESWVHEQSRKAHVEVWTLLVSAADAAVQGPVVLASEAPAAVDRVQTELLARARQLPLSEQPFEEWTVTVRPVRARTECMTCHDPSLRSRESRQRSLSPNHQALIGWTPRLPNLKPGDPIAWLVYFSRQAR